MIKVFIIDDSAIVRKVLTEIFTEDPEIDVVGAASDPIFAMDKMAKENWPDVIVLDIEMPRMDGITFLKKLMTDRPTPTVICSTLAISNSETSFLALANGAVDIITKPKVGLKDFLNETKIMIIDTVKAAAGTNLKKLTQKREKITLSDDIINSTELSKIKATDKIIAIGTSTGGTHALEVILQPLPISTPAIVIVQHMPEKFTLAFANRLNKLCNIEVREAKDGDKVLPGLALIAPGNKHMQLKRSGAQYTVEITDGPLINRHRPSVDVLFRSVARSAGRNATGIIMTGMGDDGATGLLEMHNAGAYTIAQDEATSVVYGMPKEAVKKGGVEKIVPLEKIPNEILQ